MSQRTGRTLWGFQHHQASRYFRRWAESESIFLKLALIRVTIKLKKHFFLETNSHFRSHHQSKMKLESLLPETQQHKDAAELLFSKLNHCQRKRDWVISLMVLNRDCKDGHTFSANCSRPIIKLSITLSWTTVLLLALLSRTLSSNHSTITADMSNWRSRCLTLYFSLLAPWTPTWKNSPKKNSLTPT